MRDYSIIMNRESNSYTIIYASVMVVIVAIALAFTAQALKKPQNENERIDKMQQILRSVKNNPEDKGKVTEVYASLITKELLVDEEGNITDTFEGEQIGNNDAFKMNTANTHPAYPVFVAQIEGDVKYVFPIDGKGLWGPIWGYLSVNSDGKSVYGADFSHKGETPGLGAEIAKEHFSSQFTGKELFKEGEFRGIAVVKPGQSKADQDFVDGISGGTLTSNGVNDMLIHNLGKRYQKFLQNVMDENIQ